MLSESSSSEELEHVEESDSESDSSAQEGLGIVGLCARRKRGSEGIVDRRGFNGWRFLVLMSGRSETSKVNSLHEQQERGKKLHARAAYTD